MGPTLLRILHAVGLTDLTDDEVRAYCRIVRDRDHRDHHHRHPERRPLLNYPDFLRAPAVAGHVAAAPPPRCRVHTRWMIRRDMPEVVAIEAASFARPRSLDDFLTALRGRDCIGYVAEDCDGRVVGFMVYRLCPGEIGLLDFAVHPEYRRRGVGRQMIARVADKLSPGRRTMAFLRVRETALGAQLFFADSGFEAVAVERGHYAAEGDTGEDAYLMNLYLPIAARGPWEAPCPPRDREREGG